jgi:hypothetical protein
MWPFSSSSTPPPTPPPPPTSQSKKDPAWFDAPREPSQRGPRAYRKDAKETSNVGADFNTIPDAVIPKRDQNEQLSTSIKPPSKYTNPAANPSSSSFWDTSNPRGSETDLDKENDKYFDADGRFNPIGTNNGESTSKFASFDQDNHSSQKKLSSALLSTPDTSRLHSNPKLTSSTNISPQSFRPSDKKDKSAVYENSPWHEIAKRAAEAEEAKFQQELSDDTALWDQKERLHNQKVQQSGGVDPKIDPKAPYDMKGKRLFRRFDTSQIQREQLGEMYAVDADGLPTTAMSFGHWEGVPTQTQVAQQAAEEGNITDQRHSSQNSQQKQPQKITAASRSHVKRRLPPNVTRDGTRFTVIAPKSIDSAEFSAMSIKEQEMYQNQLLDYQKFNFRKMTDKQRELMLLSQWDKLTPEQQDECREFQYLHLNFNIRKRTKHMTEAEKNDFLKEKHFDQQRVFLLQPLSFELSDETEELKQFIYDDDDADYYLEEYKKPRDKDEFKEKIERVRELKITRARQTGGTNTASKKGGKYDEYIKRDLDRMNNPDPRDIIEDDPDGLSVTIRKLKQDEERGEKKIIYDKYGNEINWKNVIQKYSNSDGSSPPTEEEMELIKEQLRQLTPQQQFNILFRQHEKQLKELERFHNAQTKRITDMKMKEIHQAHKDKGSPGKLTPDDIFPLITKDKQVIAIRQRQASQRKQLLSRQEKEHEQLSRVLLAQNNADKEHNRKEKELQLLKEKRRKTGMDNSIEEDEIDQELKLLEAYKPTYKSTGRPLEDEITQKRKELLWRKQEEQYLEQRREEAFKLAQLDKEALAGKNRDKMIEYFEKNRQKQEHEYSLLKTRGKMIDLKMPITMKLYRPYHRYLIESNREKDPRARYMHKTLGMLLFGVNVRWNGGIINGLLSTMVPVGKLPNQSDNESNPNGYYVDIEHRVLDFTNLYNYYGVAAALYNPSIMPSFSHALYEDPQLDPMTNPNVVGFDQYEEMYVNSREINQEKIFGKLNPDINMTNLLSGENQPSTATATTMTTPQSQFNVPLPNNKSKQLSPEELAKIQEKKLKEYQDSLNNPSKPPPSDLTPLSSLKARPEAIVSDPFLSTPVLMPLSSDGSPLTFRGSSPDAPDQTPVDIGIDADMDELVDQMLKYQESRGAIIGKSLQGKTNAERRAELNSLIPPNMSFIDDTMSSKSRFETIQDGLVEKMNTDGLSLQQMYQELVYNTSLSPEEKHLMFQSLQNAHQKGFRNQNSINSTTTGQNNAIVSKEALTQRKQGILGNKFPKDQTTFSKIPIWSQDDLKDTDITASGNFNQPILVKAMEMQSFQDTRKAQLHSNSTKSYEGTDRVDFSKTFEDNFPQLDPSNDEKAFIQAHFDWDSDKPHKTTRFASQQHQIQQNQNNLPSWSSNSAKSSYSDDNLTDIDEFDRFSPTQPLTIKDTQQYWSSRTKQQAHKRQTNSTSSSSGLKGWYKTQQGDDNNDNSGHEARLPPPPKGSFGPGTLHAFPEGLTHENLNTKELLEERGIIKPRDNKIGNADTENQPGGFFSGAKGLFGGMFG